LGVVVGDVDQALAQRNTGGRLAVSGQDATIVLSNRLLKGTSINVGGINISGNVAITFALIQ
jgi:hypothetical protein